MTKLLIFVDGIEEPIDHCTDSLMGQLALFAQYGFYCDKASRWYPPHRIKYIDIVEDTLCQT